jgi:protein SCO1
LPRGELSGIFERMKFRWLCIFPACAMVVAVSCKQEAQTDTASEHASTTSQASTQVFQVKGVVVELDPDGKNVRIKHEEIPGYMGAMTMLFEARPTNELTGLATGDSVSFRMSVTDTDGWIDQIKKLDVAPVTNTLPMTGPFRAVRDVEPLNVGDLMPEYHFTNQLGQAVSLSQFRGQALAITFIFTRCPFPLFCPLMSRNFEEVQKKLLAQPNAPTNWHLLTITFDPEYDTPPRLKGYAKQYNADPAHWSFLTGALIDITAITEQCGLLFWREGDGVNISHNLRTAVVDAQGRVQKILPENKWTTEELGQEIVKAAQVKP